MCLARSPRILTQLLVLRSIIGYRTRLETLPFAGQGMGSPNRGPSIHEYNISIITLLVHFLAYGHKKAVGCCPKCLAQYNHSTAVQEVLLLKVQK